MQNKTERLGLNGKQLDDITDAMKIDLWELTLNYNAPQDNFGQMVFMYETTKHTRHHQPFYKFRVMVGIRDATTGNVKIRTTHTVSGTVEKVPYGGNVDGYGYDFLYDVHEFEAMRREIDGLMRGYQMAIEALNCGIFSL